MLPKLIVSGTQVSDLVSRDGCAALPCGATGLSAICECGIS